MAMSENEAIKVLEKPSKHIRMVHKTKNEMEFYTFSSDLVEAFETAIQALEEIQQYRAICTIEEFKALKEKSVAKKAKWHPNPCAEDNRIPICPNCNTIMVRTEIFGRTIDEHCVSCGQAIDWSE